MNRPLRSTCLFFPNPRITDAHCLARFYIGSGDLNSEHPANAAGILPSESFLQSYDNVLSQVRQESSWKNTSAQSKVPQPISKSQQKDEKKKDMIHSQEGDLVVGSLLQTLRQEELRALEEREESDIHRATWLKCTVQICADKSGMNCDPGH